MLNPNEQNNYEEFIEEVFDEDDADFFDDYDFDDLDYPDDLFDDFDEYDECDEECEDGFIDSYVIDEDDDDSDIEVYDVYALQCLVDGFGNDTFTIALFNTYEDALEKYNDMLNREHYHEWQLKIVGQNFGTEYRRAFDED